VQLEAIRTLYGYHRWANRRLFDAALPLGDGVRRDMGKAFSCATLQGMFTHLYGADFNWLRRWKGQEPGRILGDGDVASMPELRRRWDPLEEEQRAFIESLTPADLARAVLMQSGLRPEAPLQFPLGLVLQHVANHATHHRSEIATMLTMLVGPPPGTDLAIYHLIQSGQLPPEHVGWQ
jgi:uncharacterized damage-inducible protein DinB